MNNIFGNVLGFPAGMAAGMTGAQQSSQFDGFEQFRQQCGNYAAQSQLTPIPTPDECKQNEIGRKNRTNYARWLARMQREPLNDVSFR
jgi:hypothetical protein